MATVTIKIAERGTPLDGGGKSAAGHMWYTLDDGTGKKQDWGFAGEDGQPYDDGNVLDDDSSVT